MIVFDFVVVVMFVVFSVYVFLYVVDGVYCFVN